MKARQCLAALAMTATIFGPSPLAAAQIAEIAKAQAADPIAPYVKASGWVQSGDGPTFVELLLDDANAGLRLRSAKGTPRIRILEPHRALELLADRRMEFLWAPLIEWAGPTLEKMRDRNIAHLRAAAATGTPERPPTTTSESVARPKIRTIVQLANFLTDVGQGAEAKRILQDQLRTMKPKTDHSWAAFEWFSVASAISMSRWERGDSNGAIAQYELIERTLGTSPYTDNATISRASLLARSGRYADALSTIDPLFARWSSQNREYKVGGSERQFAWIRACALEGLGRHSEAEAAFRPVLDASETYDPHYFVESDEKLQLKGRVCMRSVDGVTTMMIDQLKDDITTSALLTLQPGYRPSHDVELWAKVRSDENLAKIARERMRVLPPELTAALNDWRQ